MEIDFDRSDEAVLAMLSLGRHDGARVWKAFDWDVMQRLHEKRYITDPASKAKSVALREHGLKESDRLLSKLFSSKSFEPSETERGD